MSDLKKTAKSLMVGPKQALKQTKIPDNDFKNNTKYLDTWNSPNRWIMEFDVMKNMIENIKTDGDNK